jgi:hypothetical protein
VTAGYASEAGRYLEAAAEDVKLRPGSYTSWNGFPVHPSRPEEDPVRRVLALAGIGQALLAVRDTLDERLADVADAVTCAGSQVSEAVDPSHARGRRWLRWPWHRRPRPALAGPSAAIAAGAVVLSADEADTVWQALADAAAWRATQDDDPAAGPARHAAIAAEYAALRLRLGGDHR